MKSDNKRKNIRRIIEVVLVLIVLAIIAYLLHKHTPKLIELLEKGDVSGIEKYIRGKGDTGFAVLILLQIIETVAIVIPAMPVYICAGAVYGKFIGFLMCYVTNVVMNVILFSFARRMKATTAEFEAFEKNPKLEEWMKDAKHMDRVVFLMCLLPIIPNGMIPYISAQTSVSLPAFTRALAAGCLPSIFAFAVCGDFLLSEHFHITLPVVIILVIAAILFMVFRKRITAWLEPKIREFLGVA